MGLFTEHDLNLVESVSKSKDLLDITQKAAFENFFPDETSIRSRETFMMQDFATFNKH